MVSICRGDQRVGVAYEDSSTLASEKLRDLSERFGESQPEWGLQSVFYPCSTVSRVCVYSILERSIAFAANSHLDGDFWDVTDTDLMTKHQANHAFVICSRSMVSSIGAEFLVDFSFDIHRWMRRHPSVAEFADKVVSGFPVANDPIRVFKCNVC